MAEKSTGNVLRYPEPKIISIDCGEALPSAMKSAGYNVTVGTFGGVEKVERSNSLFPVSTSSSSLPGLEEQDIVFANLQSFTTPKLSAVAERAPGVSMMWASAERGAINARPLTMHFRRDAFDRIWSAGGIFVFFVSPRSIFTYQRGRYNSYRGDLEGEEEITVDNWGMLSELGNIVSEFRQGTEIRPADEGGSLGKLLASAGVEASYSCIIGPAYNREEQWTPLLVNKRGECVGGMLRSIKSEATALLIPPLQLSEKAKEFLERHLSELNPRLFPHVEGSAWVRRDEYEIREILRLRKEIDDVKNEAASKIAALEASIDKEITLHEEEHVLLQGTDDKLVQAVIKALRRLGFTNVIDVDEVAKAEGKGGSLREDIQVHDRRPTLIIDVKGINGMPDDSESTQAEKHATMRMREWNRTDVKPLTIINYERRLPPHDRNPNPYRAEIVGNATDSQLGLMTTWDLFRILRNAESLGWPKAPVIDIFFRSGRIEPIPSHYEFMGEVVNHWEAAFGVRPLHAISVGDHLAIEVGDTFTELPVSSLNIKGKQVETAPVGSDCGIAFSRDKQAFKKGARVFRVKLEKP